MLLVECNQLWFFVKVEHEHNRDKPEQGMTNKSEEDQLEVTYLFTKSISVSRWRNETTIFTITIDRFTTPGPRISIFCKDSLTTMEKRNLPWIKINVMIFQKKLNKSFLNTFFLLFQQSFFSNELFLQRWNENIHWCSGRVMCHFPHQMKHGIHDLNQMALFFYQYLVPKKRTCVQYEAFVVQSI